MTGILTSDYNPPMPEHDVLYHELLEALQAGGCAICRLARRASDSYLHAVIYEGVTDVKLREALREARGLCYRHAWRLAGTRGAVLGTAIVYRDVINTLAKALETRSGVGARFRLPGRSQPGLARALAPSAPCPACALEEDAQHRAAGILARHLDDDAIAAAYLAAGGLCLPHLLVTLGHAGPQAADTLAEWQARAWCRLRDELDELIRKHDYRFAHEPLTPAESVAWQRAVAAAIGENEPAPIESDA
ncbi:MAG: DUF6062 family protein [Anaerolineae bacterium]|nr:DUF6062 family protein [Anaerolineae bacterium]